jgi:hypothetical protein
VLKYGGEKALTKQLHVHDEAPLKLNETLEVNANVTIVMGKNSLSICVGDVGSTHKINPEATEGKTKIDFVKSKLGITMHKLYNLETDNKPEKPLNIDLGVDLYQMEDV